MTYAQIKVIIISQNKWLFITVADSSPEIINNTYINAYYKSIGLLRICKRANNYTEPRSSPPICINSRAPTRTSSAASTSNRQLSRCSFGSIHLGASMWSWPAFELLKSSSKTCRLRRNKRNTCWIFIRTWRNSTSNGCGLTSKRKSQ